MRGLFAGGLRRSADPLLLKPIARETLAEIQYIESYNHNIVIHQKAGDRSYPFSLSEAGNLLPPGQFCRCHNSYLVNMEYMEEISRKELFRLPIGWAYLCLHLLYEPIATAEQGLKVTPLSIFLMRFSGVANDKRKIAVFITKPPAKYNVLRPPLSVSSRGMKFYSWWENMCRCTGIFEEWDWKKRAERVRKNIFQHFKY